MCKHHQTSVNNLWDCSRMRDIVDTRNNSIVRLGKKTNNDNFNILKSHFLLHVQLSTQIDTPQLLFDFIVFVARERATKNQNRIKLKLFNLG